MTTSIEKGLSRLAGKIAAVDARLDAMQRATAGPSALAGVRGENLGDVIAGTALDNLANAAGCLRALHEGVEQVTAKTNPFGKPASAAVIEFTETQGE